jgi:hypothetical protein
VDQLQRRVAELVDRDAQAGRDPVATVAEIRRLVHAAAGSPAPTRPIHLRRSSPRMSEPWFC